MHIDDPAEVVAVVLVQVYELVHLGLYEPPQVVIDEIDALVLVAGGHTCLQYVLYHIGGGPC